MDLSNLSLEEKIGQLFIVGYEENVITDEIKVLIQKYKIGGIILYKRKFINYKGLVNFINALKELNKNNPLPLFIGIDQEGGRVNRLPKEINNFKSPLQFSQSNNINLLKEATKITSQILKETGYNMNFAPVLDIKNFDNKHSLGDRCYGENEETVSKNGITVMQEFQRNNIISVIKHFPGHGATKLDSHFFLPIITKKKDLYEKEDIKCFKNAIENGADAIMIGHLLVTNIDILYPSSLSSIFIKEILRKKYNFNGVIITDSFKMLAIKALFGDKKAIKRAILAGNDIVMLKYTTKKEINCLNYIKKLVINNKISISRIDESVNRIIKLKEKYHLNNEYSSGIDIDNINSKIKIINEKI